MKKLISLLCFILIISPCSSQYVNCKAFKKDKKYFRACLIYTKACEYKQGSKKAQLLLDKAINICPYFDHAYYVKAIPYLKRGNFITWKTLIDKAVEYNTLEYLGYRGGCRFQFLRDYNGAINDIEHLLSISHQDIGYTYNGDYHLNVILALSYKGLGNVPKAIEILEKHMKSENYYTGLYDNFHLGVLKMENSDYDGAIDAFNKQIDFNDSVAETYFYLAIIWKAKGNKFNYLDNLSKAKVYYLEDKELPGRNSFMDYIDKIYLSQIEEELNVSNSLNF